MPKLSELFSLDDENSVRWLLGLWDNEGFYTKEGTRGDWARRLLYTESGIYKSIDRNGLVQAWYREFPESFSAAIEIDISK